MFPRAPCAFFPTPPRPPSLVCLRTLSADSLLILASTLYFPVIFLCPFVSPPPLRLCTLRLSGVPYSLPVLARPRPFLYAYVPGVRLSLHPLPASASPANPRGTHLVPEFMSPLLPSHIPSDLLNSLYKPLYLCLCSLQASVSTFRRKARRAEAKSHSFILPQAGRIHRHTGNPLMASVLCMIMLASRKQKPGRKGVQCRGRKVGHGADDLGLAGN